MTDAILFGSYELLDRIAEGGMAEVWRARSRGVAGFEKTVVIKRVLPALMANPGFAELLVREAKIAALLNHPNIVQIFDLGEQDGAYFIAMEYLEGKDLGQAMSFKPKRREKDFEGLSLPLKLWIIAETAKALDYAHRRKGEDGRPLAIVHRDVSPQNVLLGYEGAVKVADFGIARADERGLGRGEDPKVLRGKYAYMSPEQARGEHLDRRSDLFSLGIVLYELLVGKRLFRATSTRETLERVRSAAVPPVDAAALGLPAIVPEVLARCLAADREDRYPSASAVNADLSQAVFDMGQQVGEAELAAVMTRMFPMDEASSPNKLRVDLMMRAYDDATSVSNPGLADDTVVTTQSGTGEGTHAFPASRKLRSERRRVALMVATEREGDTQAFEAAVHGAGGFPMPPIDDVREAVFGHAGGGERAVERAARAALELRRQLTLEGPARLSPVPAMAVLGGHAIVFEAGLVEPVEETHVAGIKLLSGTASGELCVDPDLCAELARVFVVSGGERPVIEGYRGRGDRDALDLRRRSPLAGRRHIIRQLTEAVVAASEQRASSTFLILGEVGSGKSRVLAELRAVAAPQNVLFVSGRGDVADAERNFGALTDLFRDLCGVEDGDGPGQRFEKVGRLRVLGLHPRQVRFVGELLGLNYPVARDERPGRPRGLELVLAARKALRALARDRAIVLSLEDLHWMDESTRQLLPLLVESLVHSRIVTVMTARFGMPLPAAGAQVLTVRPLSGEASGRLFAAAVGARAVEPDLVARIEEETAGNPAWIEAMAEALEEAGLVEVEEGVARLSADRQTPVTEGHRALAVSRLAELRVEDRELTRFAAAFASGVRPRTLAAVRGLPQDVAEGGMKRLLVQRMLVPVDGPEREEWPPRTWWPGGGAWGGGAEGVEVPQLVALPGSLIRRTILDLLGDTEARRLHGSIAAVLEREGAGSDDARIEILAHHAARSVDRRRAPDYLARAAQAAEKRGDRGAAARHLSDAARLLRSEGHDDGDPAALDLSLRAAELALDAGDHAQAEEVLSEVEGADASRADEATRVRLALAAARAAAARDDWDAARAVIEEVSGSIESLTDATLQGRAFFELGQGETSRGNHPQAAALFGRSADSLASTGADGLRGRALCARAVALAYGGRIADAEEVVASALALMARSGHGELRHLSLAAMAVVEDARGRPLSAAGRWKEAAEVAEQEGDLAEAARLSALSACAFVEAGEESPAVPLAEQAVRLGRQLRFEQVAELGAAVQAALATSAHPDPDYLPNLVRAVDRLSGLGAWGLTARALLMLAHANLALGDEGAAGRTLIRAAGLARKAGQDSFASRLSERAASLGGTA